MTWVLIAGSFAFLAYMLAPHVESIRQAVVAVRWPQVMLAILAAVPLFALKAWYHLSLLMRINGAPISFRVDLPIYLQAQIVRYLPGKIWGVVYQAQRMAGTHQAGEVVIANLWQMAMTHILAAGVITSLFMTFLYSYGWLLLLVPAVALVEYLHRNPAIESWALRRLGHLPRLAPLAARGPLPPMRWKGTSILCLEWVFFLLTFVLMLHGLVEWRALWMLATWYSGASILALAAFVVPAGIAVREAIFVAVPELLGTDTALLMVVAALARLVFVGAEILAALLATILTLGATHGRK